MLVFKFGGASVKDAEAVRNIPQILDKYKNRDMVIVISAMGKTTNALERVLEAYFHGSDDLELKLKEVEDYHLKIVSELFPSEHNIHAKVKDIFFRLKEKLDTEPSLSYNFEYDQIVCFGEILSTTIVSAYLNYKKYSNTWLDIRKYLRTDERFREAEVDFELSEKQFTQRFKFKNEKMYVVQGFIGSSSNNLSTTLGREGSDYTSALVAYFLNAKGVIIWKDVPGVLNADPKWFDNTVKLEKISYTDAIELAFYGTSVIHPRTIQPLKKKGIPLRVKSFIHPEEDGTAIGNIKYKKLVPSFIFKMDQVLLNISPRDLSFITEENLGKIFSCLAKFGLKINLIQNTAVSFRICVNNDHTRIPPVVKELEPDFQIRLDEGLELITIRYYDQETVDRVMVNKKMLLEQHSENTIQMVVKDLGN
jgi:aspartate kinase